MAISPAHKEDSPTASPSSPLAYPKFWFSIWNAKPPPKLNKLGFPPPCLNPDTETSKSMLGWWQAMITVWKGDLCVGQSGEVKMTLYLAKILSTLSEL
ncbi:conserved hypothetical protein [Ricinus communis]|uniref:Uncharacterized protein n=1 Tax=Ricinus communis TaxID=3988 RepID=B9SD39_RICCO|nr:conserved hypothetical protein [Ricinus communis]